MAVNNLTQFAKLANDEVERGVFETIITADQMMPFLQFKQHSGNDYVYNRELALPTASTVATVGDTFQSTRGTKTKKTASLTLLYVQSDQDLFVSETVNNIQDPDSIVINDMAKALTRKISNLVIHGEPEATSTEFEGLDSLTRLETRMMAMDDGVVDGPGSAETELTMDRLDQMIDEVDDSRSKPSVLIMNSTTRRKLTSLARASGSGILLDSVDMFGHQFMTYNGIPIIVNNYITNAETYNDSGTWPSSTATTVFGLKFGEEEGGFTLLHNGPVFSPKMLDLGIPFDEHTNVWRMYVYLQGFVYAPEQFIALGGIDSAL